jgi:ribonucleoside-diphosphate reductase beta chain
VRAEEPDLFDGRLEEDVRMMLDEAIACEMSFGEDVLTGGIPGFSLPELKQYLQFVGDQRLARLGFKPRYGSANPFAFMELQNVQELANFFERRVSAYQIGIVGDVSFDEHF